MLPCVGLLSLLLAPAPATVGGSASVGADGGSAMGAASASPKPRLSMRKDRPWIKRWAPENHTAELGIFLGLGVFSKRHELFRPDVSLPNQGHRELRPAFDVGARVGYYPLRFLGIEGEFAALPTSTTDGAGRANVWAARGHAVGQLGLWSVTPFVLVGGGAVGVSSDRSVLGKDVDQAMHVGAGVKVYLNRWVSLRLDTRHNILPRRGLSAGASENFEALLGLSVVLGRKKDRDAAPAAPPTPAPVGPTDRDGDGFMDGEDRCPETPGVAPDGCPVGDKDGDGFSDDIDRCPEEAGVAPDGCPNNDPDSDGVVGAADKCPDQPETRNGFEDEDGCPDELPGELQRFSGIIEGIQFPVNKAEVRPDSRAVLDGAAETLLKFPTIRVEISGHTDATGGRDLNMDLSARRAEAVRAYLISKGVDAARLTTRGAGPDEPVDSNASEPGRARNRRIEFKVLR